MYSDRALIGTTTCMLGELVFMSKNPPSTIIHGKFASCSTSFSTSIVFFWTCSSYS
jgi:hypothetical protein